MTIGDENIKNQVKEQLNYLWRIEGGIVPYFLPNLNIFCRVQSADKVEPQIASLSAIYRTAFSSQQGLV